MRVRIEIRAVPRGIDPDVLERLVVRQLREWRTWVEGLDLPTIIGPTNDTEAKRDRWIEGTV